MQRIQTHENRTLEKNDLQEYAFTKSLALNYHNWRFYLVFSVVISNNSKIKRKTKKKIYLEDDCTKLRIWVCPFSVTFVTFISSSILLQVISLL